MLAIVSTDLERVAAKENTGKGDFMLGTRGTWQSALTGPALHRGIQELAQPGFHKPASAMVYHQTIQPV